MTTPHSTALPRRTTPRGPRACLLVAPQPLAPLLALLLLGAACESPGGRLPDPQRHQVNNARAVPLDVHISVERTLALNFEAGQALVLRDHYGNVNVTVDAEGPPRCLATVGVSAASEEAAEVLDRTIGLDFQVTEDGVQVLLIEPARSDDLVYVASATLELFVPPGTPLRIDMARGNFNGIGPFGQALVETRKGELRLRKVDGGVIARSNDGDVKLRECTGGPVRASTDSGVLALIGSRTETARLETARGRIVVRSVNGGTIECLARRGSIVLEDVEASVTLEAGSGVRIKHHTGDSLSLENSSGPSYLTDVRVSSLSASVEDGPLELERVNAGSATVDLESGNLTLTDFQGRLEAKTGSGDIDAVLLKGPETSLSTEYGDITAHDVLGALSTRTGRGHTKLTKTQGDLHVVSRRGPVGVTGILASVILESAEGGVLVRALPGSTLREPWRISSGRSDLVLSLPHDMTFRLEARADQGVIDSAFAIFVGAGLTQEAGALRGDVGGGGPTLELHSERGNIAIRRQSK
ncbi:MAG: DUF4097 and DUF4098 domain-containing protein YvlB [Gammaproteobacteria bacterium]|jgi:DUF4097 and DUF4098 domain-containing protein YvlB